MMPNFIVVGAAKAGTTSLYHTLKSHPDVFMSPVKEPHYFSFAGHPPHFCGPHDEPTNTTEIISSRDKYETLFSDAAGHNAIGESSASYLYFPKAAERIKSAIPQCRIIIMLRNPVDRAYSHYRQAYALGHETLSFKDALEQEPDREQRGWRWHYQYRRQSLYADSVARYYRLFGKDNVCIIKFEELRDIAGLMRRVYSFIGVDSSFEGFKREAHNITELPRSRRLQSAMQEGSFWRRTAHSILPPLLRHHLFGIVAGFNRGRRYNPELNEEIEKELDSFFYEDLKRLSKITDIDFSDWIM